MVENVGFGCVRSGLDWFARWGVRAAKYIPRLCLEERFKEFVRIALAFFFRPCDRLFPPPPPPATRRAGSRESVSGADRSELGIAPEKLNKYFKILKIIKRVANFARQPQI